MLHAGPAFAHGTTRAKRTVGAPPPHINKNLPHTWTTMRQQRYRGKAEMSHAYFQLYRDLWRRATVLCINMWLGGDRLFGAPSKSVPGTRALLAPPKGQP
jgi:hypothetical protein